MRSARARSLAESPKRVDITVNAMIQKVTKSMAASPQPELEPVNALGLYTAMGISLETLSHAIGADVQSLRSQPRAQQWQSGLRVMVELWENLLVLFGSEDAARSFLTTHRPELRGSTPIDYFDSGRPKVVLNLVSAMREMLP